MAELKPNEVAVDREQFKALLQMLRDKDEEIYALYDGSIKVMEVIGLAENHKIKKEVFEEDGTPFSEVLKGAGSVISLAFAAQAPAIMGGAKAEKKLKEKFSFFKNLIPMFIKYGEQFEGRAPLPSGTEPDVKQLNP